MGRVVRLSLVFFVSCSTFFGSNLKAWDKASLTFDRAQSPLTIMIEIAQTFRIIFRNGRVEFFFMIAAGSLAGRAERSSMR